MSQPGLSRGARRRLGVGLVGLAVLPAGLLVGCGNQEHKQSSDTRPDPRASTEGVRVITPGPAGVLSTAGPTVQPQEGGKPAEGRTATNR